MKLLQRLFLFLSLLLALPSLLKGYPLPACRWTTSAGIDVITITTAEAIGDTIVLTIDADGPVEITGAVGIYKNKKPVPYRLTSQSVTIRGRLISLDCTGNFLTTLDVSGAPTLTYLNCTGNELTSLDVSRNPALTTLICPENELTSLDVSGNPALMTLMCSGNKLGSLALVGNPALMTLVCSGNELTSLDVSDSPALKKLECYGNRLVGRAMTRLIEGLPARTIKDKSQVYIIESTSKEEGNVCLKSDVAKAKAKNWQVLNYALEASFDYEGSAQIPAGVDVITMRTAEAIGDTVVLRIEAGGAVEITGATAVYTKGDYGAYRLTSQAVTIFGKVFVLTCTGNKLTSLDVSGAPALRLLNCGYNQLTSLDVSGSPALTTLKCHGNRIAGDSMTRLVESLPKRTVEDDAHFTVVNLNDEGEQNVFLNSDVAKAKAKNWSVFTDGEFHIREKCL